MGSAFPFSDPGVEAVFAAYPDTIRDRLLVVRDLILDTAASLPRIGELVETLKWGEPAYLPSKPRIGTTVRISTMKGSPDGYAVYLHCQTTLIDSFRQLYPEQFAFAGNRAITFTTRDQLPADALRHCIAMALTYHLDARERRR